MACSACGGEPVNRLRLLQSSVSPDGPHGLYTTIEFPGCERWVPGPGDDDSLRLYFVGRATPNEKLFLDSDFSAAATHAKTHKARIFSVSAIHVCSEEVERLLGR